jgi:hypothetical protein
MVNAQGPKMSYCSPEECKGHQYIELAGKEMERAKMELSGPVEYAEVEILRVDSYTAITECKKCGHKVIGRGDLPMLIRRKWRSWPSCSEYQMRKALK